MTTEELSTSGLFKKAFRIRPKRKTSEVVVTSEVTSPDPELTIVPALQYSNLGTTGKNVRLLEILPGRDFEPLRARIIICDLDTSPIDRPAFIALSYMWDQGSKTRHVECEESRIDVGENLWQFLKQYRRSMTLQQQTEETPSSPTPLWIDAISINQQDLQERGQQVALMRDIYTEAKSVIVWLGQARAAEELAFVLTRHPTLIKVDEMLLALADLLNKPYWRRVWVVQEFVLAKTVDIWCGEYHASAKELENVWRGNGAMLPYHINQSAGMHLFAFRRKHRNTAKVKRDTLGRRNSKTFKSTIPLRDLLDIFAGAQSSEAYDKIYGFLGIATNGNGGKIIPDYSIEPVELLVSVLRNQCPSPSRKGPDSDYKFLTWLMYTLKISRAELIRYVLRHHPEVQPHIYVLTVPEFMVASVSFVSTIQDIGSYMEEAEARMPSTWKHTWLQTSMHPNSLSSQDLFDLGQAISTPDIALALDFADAHIPNRPYIGSANLRGKIISDSTAILINALIQAPSDLAPKTHPPIPTHSIQDLRTSLTSSLLHSSTLYADARPHLARRNTADGLSRYISFKGTNGHIGIACVPTGTEILPSDRICTFAGLIDSNNAFITRLNPSDDRWTIIGFAIIVLPPDPANQKKNINRTDTDFTVASPLSWVGFGDRLPLPQDTERQVCFHVHLADVMELQRCRILCDVQVERMVEATLRLESMNEEHRCRGEGGLEILEFAT